MAKGKCDICKGKMGVCTARLQKCRWVIIQPGERLNGIQEVSGSIPLISTKTTNRKVKNLAVLSYPEVLMHPTPIEQVHYEHPSSD